jgi:hypothetical protein
MRRALALALLLSSSLARAHGGLPISQHILRQNGSDTMYVPVVYWGLWVGVAGGPWKWICEEMINSYRYRKFALSTDGTFYTTDVKGVTLSTDHGCTWTAATGALAMLHTSDVAVDPVDGATAYVATGDGGTVTDDGGVLPASNGIFVTHDHGAHWMPLQGLASQSARLFQSVAVAPSDASTIYATSGDVTAPFTPVAHRSSDGGAHFTSTTLALTVQGVTPHALELLAVDPRNPQVVWARAVADVGGTTPAPRHALVRSSDGGASWVDLFETPATTEPSGQTHGVDGVAIDAGRGAVYVATNGVGMSSGLITGADAADSTAPILHPTGTLDVAQCVDVHGGALYACSSQYRPDFAAIARSTDGAQSFTSVLDYVATVGPVDCPSGTPVGDNCPMYWYTYGAQLGISFDGGVPDGGTMMPPPARHGCGCDVGGSDGNRGGAAVALVLALWLVWRAARRTASG